MKVKLDEKVILDVKFKSFWDHQNRQIQLGLCSHRKFNQMVMNRSQSQPKGSMTEGMMLHHALALAQFGDRLKLSKAPSNASGKIYLTSREKSILTHWKDAQQAAAAAGDAAAGELRSRARRGDWASGAMAYRATPNGRNTGAASMPPQRLGAPGVGV